MNLNRRQAQAMCLAGTVAVPQKMPQLARLFVEQNQWPVAQSAPSAMLVAEHRVSPKLTITRNFHLQDVAAVFVPDDPGNVDFERGTWLLSDEIAPFVAMMSHNGRREPLGIAYVREQAQVLMHVEVGMTAAESAEYYPPLPNDPSVDHYEIPQAGPAAMCSGMSAAAVGPAAMCSGAAAMQSGPAAMCSRMAAVQSNPAAMCSGMTEPDASQQDAPATGTFQAPRGR